MSEVIRDEIKSLPYPDKLRS